jgi:hypothetical protein
VQRVARRDKRRRAVTLCDLPVQAATLRRTSVRRREWGGSGCWLPPRDPPLAPKRALNSSYENSPSIRQVVIPNDIAVCVDGSVWSPKAPTPVLRLRLLSTDPRGHPRGDGTAPRSMHDHARIPYEYLRRSRNTTKGGSCQQFRSKQDIQGSRPCPETRNGHGQTQFVVIMFISDGRHERILVKSHSQHVTTNMNAVQYKLQCTSIYRYLFSPGNIFPTASASFRLRSPFSREG